MKSFSLNWKSGEQAMLWSAKRSDHMNIRKSNQHINRYCETCSKYTPGGDINIKPKIYTHIHNSGLNDVLRGSTSDQILKDMEAFKGIYVSQMKHGAALLSQHYRFLRS